MKTAIILVGILIIIGFALFKFLVQPWRGESMSWKTWLTGTITGFVMLILSGSFFYAEPGYSYLVQYPTGAQYSVLTPGYHMFWYGTVLEFKKVVTVRLTDDIDVDSETATETDNSILVRFNDAVQAKVSSSTRFRLPEDPELFRKLAVDYRNPGNLVQSSLVPVTREVVRNSARELSAQDYVTGQGGQFEQNVLDQLENGIVVLRIEDEKVPIASKKVEAAVEDTKEPIVQEGDRGVEQESKVVRRVIRVTNKDGSLQRKKHPLVQYGILVTQSTIEKVNPEKKFQEMLAHQRDAAARSAVARQEAKQAEHERQKVKAQGETEKTRIQMEQEKNQVEKLVSAETERKQEEILLIQARVAKERAEVEAKALLITANAEAAARKAKMLADGALEQKLEAWVEINKAWSQAAGNHQMVPTTVIGGEGNSASANDFIQLMTAMSAQKLHLDPVVK
jgi:regulator of protease activity HflC (stomatin/prohibitin superfamily)